MIVLMVMLPLIGLLFAIVSKNRDLVGGLENPAGAPITSPANIEKALVAKLQNQALGNSENYTPYQNASMLLVMLGLALTQGGTFGAAYEIVKERPIFKRERAVNLSVWSYVLSKVLVLSAFALFQVGATLLTISSRVDLGVEGIIFKGQVDIFITLFLAVLASISFGLFISAIVPSTDVVMYVILAQLFAQIVLSGTLFPIKSGPVSYATPGYWTMNALGSIVDLPTLDQAGVSCMVKLVPSSTMGAPASTQIPCAPAESKSHSVANYGHDPDHLKIAWAALGIHTMVWVLLTVIVLFLKKPGKD
jgi:hypothetical protein